MNNACPGCGAVYAVAEKDIGRRIACKKCSASLIVAEDGLRYDEEAPAPAPKREDASDRDRGRGRDRDRDDDDDRGRDRDDEDDRPSRKKREREKPREETAEEIAEREARAARRAAAKAELMNKLKGIGDVATWLYGIGLVLVIYAKYSGDIDDAKLAGRTAVAQEEEYDMKRSLREIDAKMEEDERKEPNSSEKDKVKAIGKEWKKRSNDLNDSVAYANYGKDRSKWWTQMYKLLGMIILAFGAIGYLRTEQAPLKRILGGVTILLILAQVVGGFPLFRQ